MRQSLTPTIQLTMPASRASRPPPRQPSFRFDAFQDNDSIYQGGSRVSVADTLNSYGDWPEEESYQGRSRRESTDPSGDPSRSNDAALRQGVLEALQVAAIGPSTTIPKSYPKIIQGATIVEPGSEGTMSGLDPDQRSMAGEVFAGRIVHSRPAPPPPIQEMPEPEEERTRYRAEGREANQGRNGRAVKFEALPKHSGYEPPLSEHLDPSREGSGPATSSAHPSAEDYLQMGIDKHEQSQGDEELSESAHYFRKAAEGGSAAGCVFYGLALRHGWGVQRDEKQAFGWLEMGCATVMQKPSTDVSEIDRRQSLMPMGSQTKLSVSGIEVVGTYLTGLTIRPNCRQKSLWLSTRLATASSMLGAFQAVSVINPIMLWPQCITAWVRSKETGITKNVSRSYSLPFGLEAPRLTTMSRKHPIQTWLTFSAKANTG